MNCNKAEEAMMQYMDKKIKPIRAVRLNRHIWKCERCRSCFLAYDKIMEETLPTDETGKAFALTDAPEGFTASVMARVKRLPMYQQPAVTTADIVVRVIWCLCAVLAGVGLGIIYNREAFASFVAASPQLTIISQALTRLGVFVHGVLDQFTATGTEVSMQANSLLSGVNYLTLVFVVMLAVLLVVLYRGEHSKA